MALINCPECGKEISDKAVACPHCGCPVSGQDTTRVEDIEQTTGMDSPPETQEREAEKTTNNKTKIWLIVAAVVLVIWAVVIYMQKTASIRDFHNLSWATDSLTCTISKDGKTMLLDSNPNDVENFSYGSVMVDIEHINEELNIPESVLEKMYATRALDGRQEETYGNITISWIYHPDHGLEVIYEIK